nr:OmpA family [uncultured organism]
MPRIPFVILKRQLTAAAVLTSLILSPSVSLAFDRSGKLWLQGDLGGGYQKIDPKLASEIPKSGMLLGGRVLAEYRTDSFGAFGLGFGLQQTWQDGETETREQQYILRAALVDGSYLYPFFNRFLWLGWLLRTQTGKGGRFDFSDIETLETLITTGPQIRFNFATENFDWVLGASVLTAINSSGRSIQNVPVYVGISIPISYGEPVSSEPVVRGPQSVVSFDARLISFDFNKAELKPESKEFLGQVADLLKSQNDNWKSIVVSGHTDTSGKMWRNRILSAERATAVMNYLVELGVPAARLKAVGYGPEKPLPGLPTDSPKNRRVELLFKGVLDGVKIDDAMSALKSAK